MYHTTIKPAFFSLLAGMLAALSMPTAFAFLNPVAPLFLIIGLSFFFVLFTKIEKPGIAFLSGWFFGFGYFLISLFWIGNALLVEGNEYKWAWPLAVTGLPFMLSFFPALAVYATKKIAAHQDTIVQFLLFCVSLALCGWLRGNLFTGFPWNLFGYSWFHYLPVIQLVSVGGIYFLTLFSLLWCTAPALLFLERKKKTVMLVLLIALSFICNLGWGLHRLSTYEPAYEPGLTIRIVQPNIPQHEKWDGHKMLANFRKTIALSSKKAETEANTTYVIWPETTMSYLFLENPAFIKEITSFLKAIPGNTYLLSGALRRKKMDNDTFYFNSLVVISEQGDIESAYNKSHLVPFGEYIPLKKWIPLLPIVQFSGFIPGNGITTSQAGGETFPLFTPLICYEILFPGHVAKSDTDFIVNVTNDGWYGESAGPYQHMNMAVFRAIEEGVPVIRVANTGISGVINPMGQFFLKTRTYTEFVDDAPLPKRLGQKTPYRNNKETFFFVFIAFIFFFCVKKGALFRKFYCQL